MEPPVVKEKRVFTPEHLAKLTISREKALAVRQKKAQEKALIKDLETKEHTLKMDTVKEKLSKIKLVKEPEPESESESDNEVIVKKKKKKKSKKIVIVEDTDSDEEQQQIIFVKRTKPIIQPIQQTNNLIQQPVCQPVPVRRTTEQIYAEHYQRNQRRI